MEEYIQHNQPMKTQKIENFEQKKSNPDTSWIEQELRDVIDNSLGEQLPVFKIAENCEEEFEVDISNEWITYKDQLNNVAKKIIPVIHKGEKKNFWLNCKNPIYRIMLQKAKEAKDNNHLSFMVRVHRSGSMKNTRYIVLG